MGTWGDGLYDNDSALDRLSDLVRFDGEEPEPARWTARAALYAWMDPTGFAHHVEPLREALAAREDLLPALPADVQTALSALLAAPERATEATSRAAEVRAVLGGYCDGPRLDLLLRCPGAEPAIAALAEDLAGGLDALFAAKIDLYEAAGDLAALGVILELSHAGLWRPTPARVETWRAGLAAIDKATRSERGFWWKYVARVRRGLDLLAPAPASSAPVRRAARPPAPAAPEGPRERFHHPKFGAATLLARVGVGDAATLELRFDDGVTRKILARFVAPLRD